METIQSLYTLEESMAGDYLRQFTYPWETLKGIKELILELQKGLGETVFWDFILIWVQAPLLPTSSLTRHRL